MGCEPGTPDVNTGEIPGGDPLGMFGDDWFAPDAVGGEACGIVSGDGIAVPTEPRDVLPAFERA